MNQKRSHSHYEKLTPRMCVQLAAPHTWPASIIPTLVAAALAVSHQGNISVLMTIVVLLITILLQSAVNALNDYYDYKKGADSKENQVDPADAVLVYNNVNPKYVKRFCVALIVLAFVLGLYVIKVAGIAELVIALIAVAILVGYSAGKTPISYLPIGEFCSGFTMGTLIMLACYLALTGDLSIKVVLLSLPILINIGLILLTNNTCDIEKDSEAGRHTIAVVLGRDLARSYYRLALLVSIALIIVFAAIWFRSGLLICVFMIVAVYPLLMAIWKNPLVLSSRVAAMSQILSINIVLGISYALVILFGSAFNVTLF